MTIRRLVARAALLLALAFVAGCQTWHAVSVRPGVPAFEGRASQARITLADDSIIILNSALVMADTVLGTSPETGLVHRTPNGAIRTLELRRTSKTRTIGLLVAHASLVISGVAIVIWLQPHYRGAF